MILWDVDVWVYAFRPDSPLHLKTRQSIEAALIEGDPFLFLPFIAASFMRLVTNPRIFLDPSDPVEAWRFLDHLETSPACHIVALDRQAYALFKHLCLVGPAVGNHVPDAMLAATALRFDAELITGGQGFSRYPGVRVQPL